MPQTQLTKSHQIKIAIYARTSTKDQKCEMQLNTLREYCKNHNYEIYEEYVDLGWSGAKESRPQFNMMLEDMRIKRFDAILVWKIDRLSRSMQHFMNIFHEMRNKNIDLIATTQPINTQDSSGRLLLQIIGAFAEFEREMIAERVKAGKLRSKIKQGRKMMNIDEERIKSFRKNKYSLREIAKITNVSYGTVNRVIQNTRLKN